MRIGITGASGHIGTVVTSMLLGQKHAVRVLKYYSDVRNHNADLEAITGDVLDSHSLLNFTSGCDVVIHAAAKISLNSATDPTVYPINFNGTKNVFEAALKSNVKKFIYISSIHAYQQHADRNELNEHAAYCTDSAVPYDRSKRDAQQYVLGNVNPNIEVTVVNPTSVVGPPDYRPSKAGQAILDIYNRKVPALLNGGFDFCDVRDVSAAIVNAIERGRNGENYLLSGKWYPIKAVADYVALTKNKKNRLPVLPIWMGYAGLPFEKAVSKITGKEPLFSRESIDTIKNGNKNISSTKAANDLRYHCRPLEQTIKDLINWFKQNGTIN